MNEKQVDPETPAVEGSHQPAPDQVPAPQHKSIAARGTLQPFIIAVLATALVTGLVVIIQLSTPDEAWRWLQLTAFLIALEAVYTSRWLAHPERRHLSRNRYRLAELTVIALVLRLLTWSLSGGLPDWQTWRGYLLSPLTFVDGLFFGYLLCGLFAWERAITFNDQLRALSVSYAEEGYYTLPVSEQRARSYDRPVDRQRPDVFRSLVASWLGGGMLLAFCAALSTVDLGSVELSAGLRNITRLGLNEKMLVALLVYFILGLWVVSQARLEMMRARWLVDGIEPDENLIRNWRRSSLMLIAVVALVAAFLPIGSTFAAAVVLQSIVAAVLLVSQLFLLFITVLVAAVLSLLGIGAPVDEEVAGTVAPTPTPVPAPVAGPLDETTALVAGGIFWILVAAVAIVALIFFLRDRNIRFDYQPLRHVLARLRHVLARLLGRLAQQTAGARGMIRRGIEALRPAAGPAAPPWRFLRVNSLPPREQIRYFYLSTVRRAADEGLPREKSETPVEYAEELQAHWPEAEEDIGALTEAFLEARYSRREFEVEEVNPVKQLWKRVRRTIRHRLSS